MTEWQTDWDPPPGQGEQAKDENLPPRKRPPVTQPRLTLPSLPKVSAVPAQRLLPPRTPSSTPARPRATLPGAERSLTPTRLLPPINAPARAQAGSRLPPAAPPGEEIAGPTTPRKPVTLIPGTHTGRPQGQQARRGIPARVQAALLFCVLTALALGLVFGGVLKNGLEPSVLNFFTSPAGSFALQAPTIGPTLPPGLDTTNINYYMAKYGFDAPKNVRPLARDEQQRLKIMLPYALAATARYDARYQQHVEPEMLLWWTHAEQIGARITYSNCANEAPPAGQSYFSAIMNCDRPDFWQLGYGNQFGNIWVLKDAFTDMYGNPNDPALVQKVGQGVLDYDRAQHTTPTCGGYSCTFPAMTIDQIMADVHWHASDHKETMSNWWASVLSRDPGINSYMLALALSSFSHAQTKNWVGCYYQEPCWQYESDSMWQILQAWKSLGG
ncbi:MAG TPA: hypothetical protein VFU69_11530 [Ktedonobacterales bacterium]|nr:hypothetical protein [Ktedonobacterales bacterium]